MGNIPRKGMSPFRCYHSLLTLIFYNVVCCPIQQCNMTYPASAYAVIALPARQYKIL
jgi:hypothetical protein